MITSAHPSPALDRSREGMVLFVVLAVIGALAALGATVFVITSTDLRIVWFSRQSATAFTSADSGVTYVRSRIEAALLANTLSLSNASVAVNYAAPTGYYFTPVTTLVRTSEGGNPTYEFAVQGKFSNAEARIEATFQRKPALSAGVFASTYMSSLPRVKIYSYYSDRVANPSETDSTGEADTGSNELVSLDPGSLIDGDVLLGQDEYGVDGSLEITGTVTINGESDPLGERIDPDPMGVTGGDLAAQFTAVAASNNNASAIPPIPASRILNIGSHSLQVLPPGNYYLSSIDMGPDSELRINNTSGVVNIYMTGAAKLGPNADVNVAGSPTAFSLYSNSSQDIKIQPRGSFRGLIYAPNATVLLQPNGSFYGAIWGDSVDLRPGGNVFIDMSLINSRLSKKIRLLTWKEVR